MYEVIFYKSRNNTNPLLDYINKLEKQSRSNKDSRIKLNKILSQLNMLQEYGTKLGEPHIKHLER